MGFPSTPLSGYPAHRNQFLRTSPDGMAGVYWCRSFQRLYRLGSIASALLPRISPVCLHCRRCNLAAQLAPTLVQCAVSATTLSFVSQFSLKNI